MISTIFENYHYSVVIVLMMTGLYVVFSSSNLIKKLVGLSVFQTSVFLLYITIGKVKGGQPPILVDDHGSESSGGDAEHYAEAATNLMASAGEAAAAAGGTSHAASEVLYSNPF